MYARFPDDLDIRGVERDRVPPAEHRISRRAQVKHAQLAAADHIGEVSGDAHFRSAREEYTVQAHRLRWIADVEDGQPSALADIGQRAADRHSRKCPAEAAHKLDRRRVIGGMLGTARGALRTAG